MEISIKETIKVILELDKKEALWLRDLVQSPTGYPSQKEPPHYKEMRRKFWDALVGVNYEKF